MPTRQCRVFGAFANESSQSAVHTKIQTRGGVTRLGGCATLGFYDGAFFPLAPNSTSPKKPALTYAWRTTDRQPRAVIPTDVSRCLSQLRSCLPAKAGEVVGSRREESLDLSRSQSHFPSTNTKL